MMSQVAHNFQGISFLKSQLCGSLLLFFIKLSNCCVMAQQCLCQLLRGAICQLFCFKDCLLCWCSSTDSKCSSTKRKTKKLKKNKKKEIFIHAIFFERKSFQVVLFKILFYLIEKWSLILYGCLLEGEKEKRKRKKALKK